MKVHMRFDYESGRPHQQVTFFLDGTNVGSLTMLVAESVALHQILAHGCGVPMDSFVSSGKPNDAKPEDDE